MKCKQCKKEVYSTINNKCTDCYYIWEGLSLIEKLSIIALGILVLNSIIIIMLSFVSFMERLK